MAKLALSLGKEAAHLRLAGMLLEPGGEGFPGNSRPADIEIELGKQEPCGDETRIERQGLSQLSPRLTGKGGLVLQAIGHAQEQVGGGVLGRGRQNRFQLADGVFRGGGTVGERGLDPCEPRVDRVRAGRRPLRGRAGIRRTGEQDRRRKRQADT